MNIRLIEKSIWFNIFFDKFNLIYCFGVLKLNIFFLNGEMFFVCKYSI